VKTLALVLMLAACGGGMSGDGDDGVGPDGGGGSGSGSGSGSGGGGSNKLYPLAMGNSWTYDVAAVGAGSICAAGTHEQHVVSANMAGGRAAFQMTNFCSGVSATYDYAPGANDEVDFYYQTSWLTLVDPMLTEGHMWPYFNTSYHWHRETSITVPAGTYSDCWTAVQDVSYSASLTYCRGVGLVRSYSSDLNGSGWDAKLSSVTIH
jgi:hypothetical protein